MSNLPPLPETGRPGRGAPGRPAVRYLREHVVAVHDGWGAPDADPLRTTVTDEAPRTIISRNRSPDVPFAQSINPYRGCEHGCIYCYARPSHAYLDLSPGLDFETRLMAKPNAAILLRRELARRGYRPVPIALGTNTDPYQPAERRRRITRSVLKVLHDCAHPAMITTKSALVERDIDLLAPMAARGLVQVYISITTLHHELAATLEPRATAPLRRLRAVARLAAAGIPTGVLFAPVIPFINDHEMEHVLEQGAAAGACYAGYIMLRLPHEVAPLFTQWLRLHKPAAAARVLAAIRALRDGRMNDPRFGRRMQGSGAFAALVRNRFNICRRRVGLDRTRSPLRCDVFTPPRTAAPPRPQLSLF